MNSEEIDFRILGETEIRRGGRDLGSFVTGAKRLGLFAYLVLARPRGFHRREELLVLFWPERAERTARNALSNMLYQIRRDLGEDLIVNRGVEEVKVQHDRLFCDAVAFEERLERGEVERALRLYRSGLLPGFQVRDAAPAFEHWLDRERTRLRLHAAEAAWALAERAEDAGRLAEARDWADQAGGLMPYADHAQARLVAFLRRVGDRAGALQAYESFAARLREEWGMEPEADLTRLIERRDDSKAARNS